MPPYAYRAVHRQGHVTKGVATAANERELAQFLFGSGLELIEAKERQPAARHIGRIQTPPPRMLAVFAAQMHDMLSAGVPFLDALTDAESATTHSGLRTTLIEIGRRISHGQKISETFAQFPGVFSEIFISILAAGEHSGDLSRTFAQLARYTENKARLNEKLRRALRYPLFLLAVTVGVTTFMMTMVVPQIVQFLQSINGVLPLPTRILITVSSLFTQSWWIVLLAIGLMALTLGLARRYSPEVACWIDGGILRLPLLGPVWRKLILARFMHNFAILFQSGLGIQAGMAGARATLANRALEARLDNVRRQVESGQALSQAMQPMLPGFALRMLQIGEQSGKLDKSLNDIAIAYDRETGDAVERLIGSLEPALTMAVGGLLAWIVLAVLGPIYGSLSTLNMVSF